MQNDLFPNVPDSKIKKSLSKAVAVEFPLCKSVPVFPPPPFRQSISGSSARISSGQFPADESFWTIDTIVKIGYLHTHCVYILKNSLGCSLHDFCNLPWAFTPIALGVLVRTACASLDILAMKRQRNTERFNQFQELFLVDLETKVRQRCKRRNFSAKQIEATVKEKVGSIENYILLGDLIVFLLSNFSNMNT